MARHPDESVQDYNRRMTEEAHGAWHRAHPEYGRTIMPHVNQMMTSKYLGKQDLPNPVVAHIRGVAMEPAGRNNEDPKWLMYFSEIRKPLKLNNTILHYLAQMLGPNSDSWVGVKCQLYVDYAVTFGGQPVGGVRVRVAKSARRPMNQITQEFYDGAAGAQPAGSGGPVFAGAEINRPSAGAGAPPMQGPAPMQNPGQRSAQPDAIRQKPSQSGPPLQGGLHYSPQQIPADNAQPDQNGEWRPPADAEFDDDIPF